jgi:hypothetical protein
VKSGRLSQKTPSDQADLMVNKVINPAAAEARQWLIKNRLRSYLKTK